MINLFLMEKIKIKNKQEESRTCLCGRSLYDTENCIFHSFDLKTKKTLFSEAFHLEFERQKAIDPIFDFSGFIFVDSIYFHNFIFNIPTNFSRAEFHGEKTFFVGAKFTGNKIDFNEAKFLSKTTDFSKAEFSAEIISFIKAKFLSENTYFINAKFNGKSVDFSNAEFKGKNTYFRGARFSGNKINFTETEFTKNIDFSEVYF